MATVPDFAAVLGTVMRTAVVDKGLKGLNIYHSVLCRQRTQRIKYISFSDIYHSVLCRQRTQRIKYISFSAL